MIKTREDIGKLSKGIVAFCVRNETSLENYHSDNVPITDERMKVLMKEIVNNMNFVLENLYNEESSELMESFLLKYAALYTRKWDDPEEPDVVKNLKTLLEENEI